MDRRSVRMIAREAVDPALPWFPQIVVIQKAKGNAVEFGAPLDQPPGADFDFDTLPMATGEE